MTRCPKFGLILPMTSPYQKLTNSLVSDLDPRVTDILTRRFGLQQEAPETLEAIGQRHHITRERVRQIVEDGIGQVQKETTQRREREKLEAIFEQLVSLLEESGHLKRQDLLIEELGASHVANHIVFILHLGDQFYKHKETEYAHPFWATKKELVEISPKLLEALCAYLRERKEVLEFSDVAKAHATHDGEKIHPDTLASLLQVSKYIARTHDGKWGLREWPEVYPKSMRDKAYVVLRYAGKPLHFVEVAKAIEQLQEALAEQFVQWKQKAVLPQTVHNELIKDPRFVLVGRGTYGLQDWGYKPGTVKDVIMDILRENGKAMTKEEIVEQTLKQRQVKESTILLNLQDKTCFLREGGGYICIDK